MAYAHALSVHNYGVVCLDAPLRDFLASVGVPCFELDPNAPPRGSVAAAAAAERARGAAAPGRGEHSGIRLVAERSAEGEGVSLGDLKHVVQEGMRHPEVAETEAFKKAKEALARARPAFKRRRKELRAKERAARAAGIGGGGSPGLHGPAADTSGNDPGRPLGALWRSRLALVQELLTAGISVVPVKKRRRILENHPDVECFQDL